MMGIQKDISTGYHAVFFTDISSELYHVRPLGAYRLATELRKHGYRVLVVEYFSRWLKDPLSFNQLLQMVMSENTLMVGYSSTFFGRDEGAKSDAQTYREYHDSRQPGHWPTDRLKIKLINAQIHKLAPKCKVFYGGALAAINHPGALTADGVDYVVQGLADNVILDIMRRLETGDPIRCNLRDGVPVIDHDLAAHGFDFPNCRTEFQHEDCIEPGEMLPLEISRGCMFKCSFCAYPLLGRKKHDSSYHRDVQVLAQELRENYQRWGVNRYMITDDTFNETTDKLHRVHEAIRLSEVPMQFSAYLRLDLIERFPEQIALLKDMGLQSCFVGVETLNEQAGRSIGKTSHSERIKQVLRDMRDCWGPDINIYAHFIAGLPFETVDTMDQWAEWIYDRADLLDAFFIHNLTIKENRIYPSEIGNNPEKFGYSFSADGSWINNMGLTQKHSDEFAWRWLEQAWSSGRMRVGGLAMIGLLNLGYERSYLNNLPLKDMPLGEFAQGLQNKFLRYQKKLFDYLQQPCQE